MGDIENLYPFERDIYYTLLTDFIKEQDDKKKQADG
jgi:hypothetical protein|tara:strand:+ start:499 stop:606 length:108 start_codon:yes stop_codon:yes gene_type:complete